MFWQEQSIEIVPATWQEVSTFYRAWLKCVSCSEFDRAERGPICYAVSAQDKAEVPAPGLDFAPLIFQSLYYIQTRKGLALRNSLQLILHKRDT